MSPAGWAAALLIALGGSGYVVYWTVASRIVGKIESRPGQVSVWTPWWMLVEDTLPAEHEHVRWLCLVFFLAFVLGNLVLFLS